MNRASIRLGGRGEGGGGMETYVRCQYCGLETFIKDLRFRVLTLSISNSVLLYCYILLHSLICSDILCYTLLYPAILYCTLLYSTVLHSTVLHSTPLHSTPRCSALLYSTTKEKNKTRTSFKMPPTSASSSPSPPPRPQPPRLPTPDIPDAPQGMFYNYYVRPSIYPSSRSS